MLIYIIDDEEYALKEIRDVVLLACSDAQIMTFMRGEDALLAIRDGMRPDICFSDIVMPGISGLEFASALKLDSPDTRIIFTTAYDEYAVEAFRIKAFGYLVKPIKVEDVRAEIDYLPDEYLRSRQKLEVKCFGYFDVFYRGDPLIFKRKQSKELLAYLIDRNGAACSSGEIALALWEDEDIEKQNENNRVRVLINDLKNTLKTIGMDNVLIREKREIAIKRELIDCDYYRFLGGNDDELDSYRGEYMSQYPWAELTNGRLEFMTKERPTERNTSVLQPIRNTYNIR